MPEVPRLPVISAPSAATIVAPAPAVARQTPLFARKAIVELPLRQNSADALGEVEADDQHYYYVKSDAHGQPVRASEWICTHLAEDVHIGAPAPMVIELRNGNVVFGSRRIAQVSDLLTTANYLTTPTLTNAGTATNGLQNILSSIFAFDLFVNNVDRHFGNYLTVEDHGVRRLYAFDFSRALFCHWPFSGFPRGDCKTRECGKLIRMLHGFDLTAALDTLDRIAGLAPNTLQVFISRMPADWLPEATRTAFVDWWSNGGRAARLADLRRGISDGTLL